MNKIQTKFKNNLLQLVDKSVILNAYNLFKAGTVSIINFDPKPNEIIGKVEENNKLYFPSIWFDGDITQITKTSCTCSQIYNCVHAVALFFLTLQKEVDLDKYITDITSAPSSITVLDTNDNEVLQPAQPARILANNPDKLLDNNDKLLNSSIVSELNNRHKKVFADLNKVLTTIKPKENDITVGSQYLLYFFCSNNKANQLKVNFACANKSNNGYWQAVQPLIFSHLMNRNPLEFMVKEDCEIIGLLKSLRSTLTYLNDFNFDETSEINEIIINKMLATNRVYFRAGNNSILKPGENHEVKLNWKLKDNGSQLFEICTTDKADIIYFTDKAWYINKESNTMGKLDLPVPIEVIKILKKAPALFPVDIPAFSQKIKELDLPIPLPVSNLKIETIILNPQPVLILKSFDINSNYFYEEDDDDLGIAFVSFKYSNSVLNTTTKNEYLDVKNDKIITYKKNTAQENYYLELIHNFGLLDNGINNNNEHEFVYPNKDQSYWFNFVNTAIPKLKEEGFEIIIDDNFAFQVIEAQEEWDLEATQGSDFWFSLDLGVKVNGKKIALLPILQTLIKTLPGSDPLANIELLNFNGHSYLPLPDGKFLDLPFARVKAIIETLIELFNKQQKDIKTKATISLPQVLELSKLTNSENTKTNVKFNLSKKHQALLDKIKNFNGLAKLKPPKAFKAKLRDYQLTGLSWLNFISEFELGGILADDMGLGKTVQALAHISIEKQNKTIKKPYLIICPTSVLPNWVNEIKKFTPSLSILALYGSNRKEFFSEIKQNDIVLTTYPLLARDINIFKKQKFQAVILDEAQMIKNPKAIVAQSAKMLNSQYRFCLTGTPIENHLGELWSLYDFLIPGFLNDLPNFNKYFRTPIEKQNNQNLKKVLVSRIRPLMLRRTKELVASELPLKNIIIKNFELSDLQRDLYETIRLSMYNKVKEAIESKGLAKSQIIILDALLKLRQVCCHPKLVSMTHAKKIETSSKLELLLSMLEELIDEGKKILLFSQFTSMLDLIIPELNKQNIKFVQIRGDTKDRATPVNDFQNGKVPLFLISLKAGGFGLNLTAADTVIHYDPWWNPAVENQATDRAHRIGQTKSIFVFKLIATNTIEEKMLLLQERKKKIADGIYGKDADTDMPYKLTNDDIELLFSPLEV